MENEGLKFFINEHSGDNQNQKPLSLEDVFSGDNIEIPIFEE